MEAAFDNRVGSANGHQILIVAPAHLNESRCAPPHFPANAITTLEELFVLLHSSVHPGQIQHGFYA
jgi:hypothetical protein